MDYPFNLHTHSILSDGCLLPSEICVRYAALGYRAIAITDHADHSNIGFVISSILRFCDKWPKNFPLKVLPGVELTHLPPAQIAPLVKYCRRSGLRVVIGHGETAAEPVLPGTNKAFLEAGVDILAHPGHISDADCKLAAIKGIYLEVTTRKSHGVTNSEVVKMASRWKAKLIIDHDSHAPADIITPAQTRKAALAAGLTGKEIDAVYVETSRFISRLR